MIPYENTFHKDLHALISMFYVSIIFQNYQTGAFETWTYRALLSQLNHALIDPWSQRKILPCDRSSKNDQRGLVTLLSKVWRMFWSKSTGVQYWNTVWPMECNFWCYMRTHSINIACNSFSYCITTHFTNITCNNFWYIRTHLMNIRHAVISNAVCEHISQIFLVLISDTILEHK